MLLMAGSVVLETTPSPLTHHIILLYSPGSEQNKKRDSTRNKSKEEEEEEKDKRSSLQPHKQEDNEGEVKRSGLKLWSKRAKGLQMKKKETPQEEVPHHSKEVTNENEEAEKRSDPQRSPEEKELQMIARGAPEERKGSDEEGSGSRKVKKNKTITLKMIVLYTVSALFF